MCRHYNNNQTSLTLPLEMSISKTHIVRAISAFVDTIPYKLVYGETHRPLAAHNIHR